VEFEIDQSRGDVFDRGETLVEGARGDKPFDHRVRDRRAGFVVAGELAQDLRLLQPVLVKLRGQLDKVGEHPGAGDHRIGHVREQGVQRVPELVEEGARVVEREQGRLSAAGLGKVHDVEHQRSLVAVELLLRTKRGHPGAAALRRPREIIAEEHPHVAAVGPDHLERAYIRMPGRDVVALGEAKAEQPLRSRKRGRDHAVERQVGLELGFVEIAARLAQLLGVVAPVPRRELEIAALGANEFLHGVAVGERALARRRPHLLQQVAYRRRRLGHGVVEPIVGEGRKAQELSALGAQGHHFGDQRLVVGRPAAIAARRPGAERLLAQVAAGG
jgi:hypothetical protein